MNSFPTCNAVDLFCFLLDRLEVSRPSRYDIFHWRRRRWESSLLAVIVEDCVVLSQKGVLDHNLDTEEVGQDGEGGSNYRWECFPDILVRNFEVLLLVSQIRVCRDKTVRDIHLQPWPCPPPPWPERHSLDRIF